MFKVKKFEARTLNWWMRQVDKIDFEPPYQRKGRVWLPYAKGYLIDSILNGFDIPKIYLADFTYQNTELNVGNKPYAVIDGKQRLQAINDFINNEYPLNNDFILYQEPDIKIAGKYYQEIKDKYPDLIFEVFEQFNIDVVSVITDDEDKIKELFIRLNQGAALKGSEVRNAMPGFLPEMARQICDSTLLSLCTFNKNRGQDKNVAAKLLLFSYSEKFINSKKKDLDKFFQSWQSISESGMKHVFETLLSTCESLGKMLQLYGIRISSEAILPLYVQLARKYGAEWNVAVTIGLVEEKRKNINKREYFDSTKQFNASYDDDYIIDSLIKEIVLYIRNSNDAYALNAAFTALEKVFSMAEKNNTLHLIYLNSTT